MPRQNPIGRLKDVARTTLEVPLGVTRKTVGRVAHTATGAMSRGRTAAGHVTKSARNQAVETAAALTGLVPGRKQKPGSGAVQPGPGAAPAVPRKSQGDPVMPATKKTSARKTSARKTSAKKTPAKKAPRSAKDVAAEEGNEVTTPVGTTGADVATNPDTSETDLQQPGTEPVVDPATVEAVASENEVLQKGADPDKG